MSKLKYTHIDLENATLVQRRHKRQTVPPGMWAVDGFLPSRSDNNLVMRPDFYQYILGSDGVYGFSGDLTLPVSDETRDILNTVSGIYGSSDLVYFTSYIPFGMYNGANTVLSDVYDAGTVSGTAGEYEVSFATLGSNIDLERKSWRGAILRIVDKYYVVDRVTESDASAQTGTLNLTTPLEDTHAAEGDYDLFFSHNPWRASEYKINTQPFGAAIMYCTPTINNNFSQEDVCGPFYTNVTESDWLYDGTIWNNYEYDGDPVLGTGISQHKKFKTFATTGTNWFCVYPYAGSDAQLVDDETLDYRFFIKAATVANDDVWERINFGYPESPESNITFNIPQPNTDDLLDVFYFNSLVRDTNFGLLATGHCHITSDLGGVDNKYPCIAHSADQGVTWTVKPDYHFDGSDWQCISAHFDNVTVTTVMWKTSDDTIELRYSADAGGTWSDCTGDWTWTGNDFAKVKRLGSDWVVVGGNGHLYTGANGQAFTDTNISAVLDTVVDIDYNADAGALSYVAINGSDGGIANAATLTGTYTDRTPNWVGGFYHILYDKLADRFIIPNEFNLLSSSDDGDTWDLFPSAAFGQNTDGDGPTNIDWTGQQLACLWDHGAADANNTITIPIKHVLFNRSYTISWDLSLYTPVNERYRATTFAVLDGYNILIGTREYLEHDPAGAPGVHSWKYFPRRFRWSSPGTFRTFDAIDDAGASGYGAGDAKGSGAFLDAVVVNGRVVIFETSSVSALVPRGDTTDPWDFDIIKDNFKILSNPIAVDDVCYVIGSDGLIWSTDGITVTEVGASFDITQFDDFREDKPVWLTYSRRMNALLVYYYNSNATAPEMYAVSLANGGVSAIPLSTISDSGGLGEIPGSVVSIEGSDVQKTFASHHPLSADTDRIVVSNMLFDDVVSGRDQPTTRDADSSYWYSELETGELYPAGEGNKTAIKHIIVETYTESSKGDNSDRPHMMVEVKSIEDDQWWSQGQETNGSITVDDTTDLTVTGIVPADDVTGGAFGFSWAPGETYTLAADPNLCSIYLYDIGGVVYPKFKGENYTVSGNVITVLATEAQIDDCDVYSKFNDSLSPKIEVDDFIESTYGWHRVTYIPISQAGGALPYTIDHAMPSGTTDTDATHHKAYQLPDGHGQVKVGINKLVEGVQIRIRIIPQYDGAQQPTITKITGISLGHVPQGRKILKATGS